MHVSEPMSSILASSLRYTRNTGLARPKNIAIFLGLSEGK